MRYYETERQCIDYFREEYEFLSNFYPACVTFEGIQYYNSEAAYQAQKCIQPIDRKQFARLSADEAKRLGRKIEMRADWDEVKVPIMRKIVEEKFAQNPILAKKLLETGDKILKEGNYWHDLFWGVDLHTGEGENHLGIILMELREAYCRTGLPKAKQEIDRRTFGPFRGMEVEFGDITQSDCECIVNAANKTLLGGSGVDGAIHREAGSELKEECRTLNGCETGKAKITKGYNLNADFVIHAVGPHYGQKDDELLLRSCYENCMELVLQHDIHSVAFPAISTGKFSYPKKEAVKIAVETIALWISKHPDYQLRVVFTCVDGAIYDYFCENIK